MTTPFSILDEAKLLVEIEKKKEYGEVNVSFSRIAKLWSAYLDKDISAFDVTNLMILFKTSRASNAYKRDNYTDIAGYAACAEQLHDKLCGKKEGIA